MGDLYLGTRLEICYELHIANRFTPDERIPLRAG